MTEQRGAEELPAVVPWLNARGSKPVPHTTWFTRGNVRNRTARQTFSTLAARVRRFVMSHVPDDPTRKPTQKPGDFPDKTKQPGQQPEHEKRGDKKPSDPMKQPHREDDRQPKH
jgi:hypothetical protein